MYEYLLNPSNVIGDIYHISGESYGPVVTSKQFSTWRSKPSEGGGCLYDYASHVLNLMEYFTGPTNEVSGTVLKKIKSNYKVFFPDKKKFNILNYKSIQKYLQLKKPKILILIKNNYFCL